MAVIDATARKNAPPADVASVDALMRDLLGKNQGESGAGEANRAGMTAQSSACSAAIWMRLARRSG